MTDKDIAHQYRLPQAEELIRQFKLFQSERRHRRRLRETKKQGKTAAKIPKK